jgi:hypothetical protein
MEKDETPPETVRAMACGNARRKLYFNPAYFEHDLLIVSFFSFTFPSLPFFLYPANRPSLKAIIGWMEELTM